MILRTLAFLLALTAYVCAGERLMLLGVGGGHLDNPGAITITYVNNGGEATSSSSTAVTTPSSLVSGNVLVAVMSCMENVAAGNVWSTPSGWTQVQAYQIFYGGLGYWENDAVYYHVVVGGEAASYTWTNTNSCGLGNSVIVQITGGAGTYTFTAGAQATTGSTNAASLNISGVGETFQTGELAIYFGEQGQSQTSSSPSLTTVFTSGNIYLGYISPSSQTSTQTVNVVSSTYISGVGVVVK